jgi:hypothetical protein
MSLVYCRPIACRISGCPRVRWLPDRGSGGGSGGRRGDDGFLIVTAESGGGG